MAGFAFTNIQNAEASQWLEGAVNGVLRRQPFLGWLDRDGRVNRDSTGRDFNWLLDYKALEAQPYVPFSQMDFYDVNYHLPLVVTPVFWSMPSAMDLTGIVQNDGPAAIVKLFNDRMRKMAEGMQNTTEKSVYNDVNSTAGGSGLAYMTGLSTFAHKSATVGTVTNACRMAAPNEAILYGGQSIGLGSHGGMWSNNIANALQMNPLLGNDYPDGLPDPSRRYDVMAPRLYNENSNQWLSLGAVAANGTWAANCIAMLSRANTDLALAGTDSMMPNLHNSGSGRYQAIKDLMRQSFRYTMEPEGESKQLGYIQQVEFEGGVVTLDTNAPANFTFSVCGKSCEVNFFGNGQVKEAMVPQHSVGGENIITGGIFTVLGPRPDPRGLSWLWIMFAGGQIRWNPKYITIMGDFVNQGA